MLGSEPMALNWTKCLHGKVNLHRLFQLQSLSTMKTSNSLKPKEELFKPELIIFDKDGTLVCFHTMWGPWCISLAERLSKQTGIELTKDVFELLGYDSVNNKVKLGPLAEETPGQIKEKVKVLLENKLKHESGSNISNILKSTLQDVPENLQIKMTADLNTLFTKLRNHQVKIAICTSDSRACTELFLTKANLSEFIDMVVCGDDPESRPKPNPHNALMICKQLDVEVCKTVMVGDTPTDTKFGKMANLGLIVGVKSGCGSVEDLKDADLIVDSVQDYIDIILPEKELN